MLGKLGGYRTALWLAIAVALTNLVGWSAVALYNPHFTNQAVGICTASFAILFGLWTQYSFIRYLGAIWMVVWAGALIWPLVSSGAAPFINRPGQTIPLLAFYSVSAVLNLLTGAILLLSKRFATEFAHEREHRPKYKMYLNWLLLTAVVLAMLVATVIDIINLASN
jgi:hypothetical protein